MVYPVPLAANSKIALILHQGYFCFLLGFLVLGAKQVGNAGWGRLKIRLCCRVEA